MSTAAKVIARERIETLLDDNSFVEIGGLVKARSTDFNIKAKDTPSDGVITGYGVINGKFTARIHQYLVVQLEKCTLRKFLTSTIWL